MDKKRDLEEKNKELHEQNKELLTQNSQLEVGTAQAAISNHHLNVQNQHLLVLLNHSASTLQALRFGACNIANDDKILASTQDYQLMMSSLPFTTF